MFNIVFLVGPQASPVRLRYHTAESVQRALAVWAGGGLVADDIGQAFMSNNGTQVHAAILTSDESDAAMQMAPHLVQMAQNKLIESMKDADPAFKLYVAKVQSAQRMQQMAPGGGIVLQ